MPLLGALLSARLFGQQPGARADASRAADGLPLVAPPLEDGVVNTMRSFSNGLTIDADGVLWCLVQRSGVQAETRELWLHRSDDDGCSWRRVTQVPGGSVSYGAVCGDPKQRVLHVGFAALVGQDAFHSAVYQRYDVERARWLGEGEVLQRATGAEDRFHVCDLALGADGTVAVMVATHRKPKQPWWSPFSSGLMVRRGDAGEWLGPFPVHTNRYGVYANLQVRDGRAHATFRSTRNHSMIGYRSFAVARRAFEQDKEVEVSVQPRSGRYVSNASSLVVHPFGSRTVLYPAASQDRSVRNGQLLIAYAGDDDRWRTEVLCEDPDLVAGNIAHEHFALAVGPGTQAVALYSKASDRHRVLYRRVLDAGRPLGKEEVVARSELAGAYARISAMRDPRILTGVQAVVSGSDAGAGLGVRAVLAPRPVKTRWQ
ncbi:MAG: hypothetical protein KAI24_06520 [Planctomycetes bacterium]|nr:hypothetical protein [Planctomycetota bacterium]